MSWIDIYDLDTINKDFESIDYARYLLEGEHEQTVHIDSQGHIAVVQEGLLRIWELIRSALSRNEEVEDFLDAELQYASETWNSSETEKRLLYHIKRLQAFLFWERTYLQKKDFEAFINKFIMKLISANSPENPEFSHKIKNLLLEALNSTSDKKKSLTRSRTSLPFGFNGHHSPKKKKFTHHEEILPPLDLDELRKKAGLPIPKHRKDTLFKEKQKISLLETFHPADPLQKTSAASSVMHSIYKDSAKFKQYTKLFENPEAEALEIPIGSSPADLEKLDDLNELLEEEVEDSNRRVTRFRSKKGSNLTRVLRSISRDKSISSRDEAEKSIGETFKSDIVNEEFDESSTPEEEEDEGNEFFNARLKQLTDFKDLELDLKKLPLKKNFVPEPVRIFGRPQNKRSLLN